eukprot:5041776-Prymnesium_polylepis.1
MRRKFSPAAPNKTRSLCSWDQHPVTIMHTPSRPTVVAPAWGGERRAAGHAEAGVPLDISHEGLSAGGLNFEKGANCENI